MSPAALAGGAWSLAGGAVGLALALGLVLLVAGLPVRRRPGLHERLAPYLRDTPRPSRLLGGPAGPGTGVPALLRPLVADLARAVDRVLGGTLSVRRRLGRAGRPVDVDSFRAEQVLWAAACGVLGLAVAAALWLRGKGGAPGLVALVLLAVAAGLVACDQRLSRQAAAREARILLELPTIAELLALAIGAGEGAVGALERVCRLSGGELSGELRTCLADARAGANLPNALQGLADRTGLASLARFVDGIVIAVERGTPLADVMRAQAQDAREAGRRAVLEQGGKKEIAMMVPVVFLVLPVTVVFALYPGLAFLRFSI